MTSAADKLEKCLPLTINTSRYQYTCVQKLGSGMYGSVFLTQCKRAVKLIEKSIVPLDEFKIVIEVPEHPNLVHAIDSGVHVMYEIPRDGKPPKPVIYHFYVMEVAYCSMLSLSINIINLRDKIRCIKDIYSALLHMKRHGYFHGDIHPKNILLTSRSFQLCDFSLSLKYASSKQKLQDAVTSTIPFACPLAVIDNEYMFTPEYYKYLQTTKDELLKPFEFVPEKDLIEAACECKYTDKDMLACDVFAFAQLITYILFDAKSFLCGKTIFCTKTIIEQYVLYAREGQAFLDNYMKTSVESTYLEAQVSLYLQQIDPKSSFNVETLTNLLNNTLCMNPAKRWCLEEMSEILEW
jgi:serine/threonine protein kinase